jgi:hypothetical protein
MPPHQEMARLMVRHSGRIGAHQQPAQPVHNNTLAATAVRHLRRRAPGTHVICPDRSLGISIKQSGCMQCWIGSEEAGLPTASATTTNVAATSAKRMFPPSQWFAYAAAARPAAAAARPTLRAKLRLVSWGESNCSGRMLLSFSSSSVYCRFGMHRPAPVRVRKEVNAKAPIGASNSMCPRSL